MKDQELFELCKQVYGKTKWGRFDNRTGATDFYYEKVWEGESKWVEEHYSRWQQAGLLHVALERGRAVPLYTSDYLLEKLPKFIDDDRRLTLQPVDSGKWDASYDFIDNVDDSIFDSFGDTSLEALLKLTLALYEAGELEAGDE